MISAALEFIHARKWLMELILLGVIVAAVAYWHHVTFQAGVQHERAAWQAKMDQANLETARAQGRAQAADKAAQGERDALAKYVTDHPLHGSLGSLCRPPRVPEAAKANASDDGTSSTTGGVQSLPSSDSLGGQGVDQLGLLSSLAARGDQLSAQVREWQGS